ncbi:MULTISPECIES: thermonuclease family protein [unclassified Pseudomonas]|uniref:thermonuclease family protein n=1 Tax=unclassified Pseudomonas TaxID=196821 RepID=UPI0024472ED7|nr:MULTISPECIES: thermonuclease family protein [unclassified Pseudomonas]MDG9926673.1 thermonuclease family protein [Pseudomonas sp. GD04042]MDH0482258.1 thermonuclease family protein [Pseudomonas sp. GD04015]MDH0603693.1 thermonuclease family protein [Pseudomonas sp. GD03869]
MVRSTLLRKASLVGAFFVSVFLVSPVRAACPLVEGLAPLRVAKVVDGDTLRLADGRSVRLIGVNAPERARDGRPAEPFAEAARKRLQTLVAANDGRVGLRVGSRARDQYGRTLAHAYDGAGRNLEAQLLAEGLGYRVAFQPATGLEDCHRGAEDEARRQRLGLWQQATVVTPFDLRSGGFALVRGKVERVQRNRGGLWIEMDGPLVLRVEPKLLRHFDVAALQRLTGREVEVRGWVIDRSRRGGVQPDQARWMLPLTHAAMLEVLP